jgi:hypothetical protein
MVMMPKRSYGISEFEMKGFVSHYWTMRIKLD